MIILKAIFKNISIIKVHIIVFALKSIAIFLSLVPLRLAMQGFFSGKTINDNIFARSDLNAFHEFFRAFISLDVPWFGVPQYLSIILVSIIAFFFLFFLFIDGYVNAGILNTLEQGNSDSFFRGMKKFGFSFFMLRLLNVILFLVLLGIILTIVAYLYLSESFAVSFVIFTLLAILFMFALKMFDHGKYLILRDNKKVGRAFIIALRSIFKNTKQTLFLNIHTLILFCAGYFLYLFLDDILIVNSTHKIWLMVLLHQITLFGKQVLRYAYLEGIGNVIYVDQDSRTSEFQQVGV